MWGGSPTKRHSRLSRTVKGDGDGHWRRDAVLGDNPRELLQDGQCLRRFAETRVVALGCSVRPHNHGGRTTGGRMYRLVVERCLRKGLRDCQSSCRASVVLTIEFNLVLSDLSSPLDITVPLGRQPAERARAGLWARGLVEDRSVLILYIVIRPLPKVRQI